MSAPKSAVAKTCVKLFNHIQDFPKEIQLLALAAAFVLMSRALRFDTSDTYSAITNLMKDPSNSSGLDSRFDAMKFHLETELGSDGQEAAHYG